MRTSLVNDYRGDMNKEEHLQRFGRPGVPWRGITIATWIAVLLSLVAIAISSRTIGRPVWWVGPPSNEAPWFYVLLPIALVTLPLEGALWRSRTAVPTSVACSVGLIATAIPDISNSPGVAVAICVVGFAALLQSIALVLVNRQYR